MMDSWIDTLPIRSVTKQLVNRIMLDLSLPSPVLVDFGVDSDNHYQALKLVLLNDYALPEPETDEDDAVSYEGTMQTLRQRVLELDAAYGNGAMLNALVKKYAPQYAKIVHFQTSWDVIYSRADSLRG